jgi:uncharacterized membrane protein
VSLSQLAAVAAFFIGYALLSHYANIAPGAKGLGAALTIAPILLIGAVMLWRWTHPLLASSVLALVGVLLVYYWPLLTKYYEWADVGQQCGAYALVSLTFGRSLWGGRVPVCTQLTAKLHGPLTPAEITYTRWATLAWTLMYALLAVVILILFFVTSLRVWSLFVNVGSFVLIGLAFVADHTLRRHVLPHRPGGIFAALRQSLAGSG